MEKNKEPLPCYSEYNEDVANQPRWADHSDHGREDDSIHKAEGLISKLFIPGFVQKFSRGIPTGRMKWIHFQELPVVTAVKELGSGLFNEFLRQFPQYRFSLT